MVLEENLLTVQLAHIVFATCAIGGVQWGTGQHMDSLSDEQKFQALRVGDHLYGSD
jgi:hypothetical protein